MSTRHDDDPVEHDPTGIRDLLSTLPEPGPMPDDLVARINAALAEEARTRAGGSSSAPVTGRTGPDDGHGASVLPLRRRSRWHVLGVAAAVVGVLGVGGLVVSGVSGDLEASLGVADTAGAQAGQGGGDESGRVESGGGGEAAVVDVQVVTTGTAYTSAGLAEEAEVVAGLTPERPSAGVVPPFVGGAEAGPVATREGALGCAQGLASGDLSAALVDVATVDGRPAAVLVLRDTAGRTTAHAVERTCGTGGDTPVITGPVDVG